MKISTPLTLLGVGIAGIGPAPFLNRASDGEVGEQPGMLVPFLNRDGGFDPTGWFQLVPKGTFLIKRKEGDAWVIYEQVVDDEAVRRIAGAFSNRQANDPGFRALIDYEHFSHDTDKSSEAAAWINRMEPRADGVWALADWTDAGKAAVEGKRYRYLSPVWLPSQVERLGPRRVRPVAVNDAGLTNKPNLGSALQPFWNRADSLSGLPAFENQPTQPNMKDQLIALFAMAATASDADVLSKAGAFLNRAREADTFEKQLKDLNADNAAYKNRYESLLKVSVESALEEHKDVITAESQDAWKNRLTSDYDGTIALLKGVKRPAADKKPVHDAGKGAAVSSTKKPGGDEAEGDPFMNRVKEVRIERKLDEADAMAAVATEEPALYETYRVGILGRAED